MFNLFGRARIIRGRVSQRRERVSGTSHFDYLKSKFANLSRPFLGRRKVRRNSFEAFGEMSVKMSRRSFKGTLLSIHSIDWSTIDHVTLVMEIVNKKIFLRITIA